MATPCPYCDGSGEIANPTIGSLVLAARLRKGMTQQGLAEKAPISRSQVADLETSLEIDMSLKTLMRIAAALGCTAMELVP